jgi:molybdate transport repressor ModE-like protein
MKNWDHLRYYLEVARRGSLSAAAKSLGVSHATVLRNIDNLEEALGVRLFKRLQSGYQLSEEGERLLEKAVMMQSAMKEFEQTVQKQGDRLAGVLRVTQTDSDSLNLYDLYAEFSTRYPEVTLEVDTSISPRNLNQQEFDVAIRFVDKPHELLVGNYLGTVEYGAYATRGYLERFGCSPALSELGWVIQKKSVNNWGGKHNDSSFGKLYRLVDSPRIVLQSDNYRAVETAVLAGVGAGFLSHLNAGKYPDVVGLTGHDLTSRNHVWVLTHRDLKHTIKVRHFMAFITDRLKESLGSSKPRL